MSIRILPLLLMLLGSLSFAAEASAREPWLVGSKASVTKAYDYAIQHDYTFIRNEAQLDRLVRSEYRVEVTESKYLRLSDVSVPYALPGSHLFLSRLSAQYHEACDRKLVVTSLVRFPSDQPANASGKSVHPTGMSIDLRVPRKQECRQWLEGVLGYQERLGNIDATLELRPAHFHIVVFQQEYLEWVNAQQPREREVAELPDEVAPAPATQVTEVADEESGWGVAIMRWFIFLMLLVILYRNRALIMKVARPILVFTGILLPKLAKAFQEARREYRRTA